MSFETQVLDAHFVLLEEQQTRTDLPPPEYHNPKNVQNPIWDNKLKKSMTTRVESHLPIFHSFFDHSSV